jgi:hypothetical protein
MKTEQHRLIFKGLIDRRFNKSFSVQGLTTKLRSAVTENNIYINDPNTFSSDLILFCCSVFFFCACVFTAVPAIT